MKTSDFDYALPPELIAQGPAQARDLSRLLILNRQDSSIHHQSFRNLLDYLRTGDVLVLNNSRVIPARLWAVKAATGGRFEILLLEQNGPNDWWAMVRPGKRATSRVVLTILDHADRPTEFSARVMDKNPDGHYRLVFSSDSLRGSPTPHESKDVSQSLMTLGDIPLPPYINRKPNSGGVDDLNRYQTVFAQHPGSVAAPTAGLHFTQSFLEAIRQKGVLIRSVTLHVGPGTFAPVKTENLAAHPMHEERFEIPADTALALNSAQAEGRRIIAVGTTSVRVLESTVRLNHGQWAPLTGRTRLFIYPPYEFKVVKGLVTNFHLPKSTLLMLVSAFAAPEQSAGRERLLAAYAEAVGLGYRFFSYGDAMLIL